MAKGAAFCDPRTLASALPHLKLGFSDSATVSDALHVSQAAGIAGKSGEVRTREIGTFDGGGGVRAMRTSLSCDSEALPWIAR